jgi:hypothetical protein
MSAPAGRLATATVGVELLDDPDADAETVARSLRHISRANRWFGGRWAVLWGLAQALGHAEPRRGARLTLLDVGTGRGDLPLAAERWAARRGVRLVPLGVELHPTAARLATDAGVRTTVGCAGELPVRSKSVDVALASQVAHHLSAESVVRLLRELDRVARRAVVVADLHRSPLAALAFRAGSRALGFDAVTRHDGLVSIRRGYTVAELAALVRGAAVGGGSAIVAARPFYRLVAAWRPAPAAAPETAP